MPVYPAENGYAIKGIGPPDLRGRDEATKLLYWSWVVELGLRAKDKELSQGFNKDGKPLRAISAATRKHRRSAMTPSGKGDPSAPPLMPARALSRTRSLLSGRAYPDRAEFWFRFDPHTGDSWARVLEVQRDRWGRDVFGVSPKAQRLIQARSYELWDRWKRGLPVAAVRGAIVPMAPAVQRPPPPKEEVGNEAWRRLFAEPAKAAQPGRPGAPGNVLLTHIFGAEGPARAGAGAVKVTPPKASPPKVTRVAMAPPKLRPKPVPPPPPTPVPGRFASYDDLHAWAKVRLPNTTIDPAGIPIENWNHLAAEFDKMAKEWPEVAERLRFINSPGRDWFNYPKAHALADALNGHFIDLNPTYWRTSYDWIRQDRAENVKKEWFPRGTEDPRATITHEWGHLVEHHLASGSDQADRGRWEAARDLFRTDGKFDKLKAWKISQYATTSAQEAFAEAFSVAHWRDIDLQLGISRRFRETLGR